MHFVQKLFSKHFFTWRRASILVAVIRAVIVAIADVDLGEKMKLSKRNKNLYILIYTKYGRFYAFLIWHDLISNSFIMIIYATREWQMNSIFLNKVILLLLVYLGQDIGIHPHTETDLACR